MSMTPDATLVVELVTEELPPKSLRMLGSAFADSLVQGLRDRGYVTQASQTAPYATPRRLAVAITHVRAMSPQQPFKQKLMPVAVGIDAQGNPTPALLKRLQAIGLSESSIATLSRESDGKSQALYHAGTKPGRPLAEGLQQALDATIEKLPIPKVMRYAPPGGYYNAIAFVRPAHRLLALHGSDIVPVSALGLTAGRLTDGHRFLSREGIGVANATAWASTLHAEGKIVPSFAERRRVIEAGLAQVAGRDRVIGPDALLDEVTSLVEWPVVLAGTFDPGFLVVPQECLILTMQQNQKYFALADETGRMRPRFLLVSNLATESPDVIIKGNERVLRARLADARFFYEQDRKAALATRVPRLDSVVYHTKLGSQGARIKRLRHLAGALAKAIGAPEAACDRAAMLAKADLTTDMVGEFPELQGTMGRYYARHDGESAEVADAIAQHYWPRFAGDALPDTTIAQTVALADKLEALAGLFGIGQAPTGDKDPFGLRRAAIGVIRIVVERKIDVPLDALVDLAFASFADVPVVEPDTSALVDFLIDRLRGYLRDQGGTVNQVEALLAGSVGSLVSLPSRLAAVQAFEALPEAEALAAANKRIVNILRKSGSEAARDVEPSRMTEDAERELAAAFEALAPKVDASYRAGDWTGALIALSTTKSAVDHFFDKVMVMADDAAVRANRLALLKRVAFTMNRVADLSRLSK
ncbi:MAG TPA: glycine--tRNA ligase subunit beta [Casimicrobiaceae bacterium]|nr:glycine--tRNA ligase subunit beta [Casimicrobiaceae bacterium]